jgi:hypothetical protein
MPTTQIRRYSELTRIETFEGRFEYLRLNSSIGVETFGFDRWLNQAFYRSAQWKTVRRHVIVRDLGLDLGVEGNEIFGDVHVHHMNPMSVADVVHAEASILDPEYLISVSLRTHNAIHFGDERLLPRGPIERKPGDTKLW